MRSTHTIDADEIKLAIHRFFEWRLGRSIDPSKIQTYGVENAVGTCATLDMTDEDLRVPPPGIPDIRTPTAEHVAFSIGDDLYDAHYVMGGAIAFIQPLNEPAKVYKVWRSYGHDSLAPDEHLDPAFGGYQCTCEDYKHRRTPHAKHSDGTATTTQNTPCKHLRALAEGPNLGLPAAYNVRRSPIADPVPEVASNAFDVSMGATWTDGHQ